MHEPLEFVIGGEERERIAVLVFGRERPESHDADDGNWITAQVEVSVGGFCGQFSCCLRAEDFAAFLPQLRKLETDLIGSAEFVTMEGQLKFHIKGDGLGRFDVEGRALDRPGTGNSLGWAMTIDQTYLRSMIASASAIATVYPVQGTRRSNKP